MVRFELGDLLVGLGIVFDVLWGLGVFDVVVKVVDFYESDFGRVCVD